MWDLRETANNIPPSQSINMASLPCGFSSHAVHKNTSWHPTMGSIYNIILLALGKVSSVWTMKEGTLPRDLQGRWYSFIVLATLRTQQGTQKKSPLTDVRFLIAKTPAWLAASIWNRKWQNRCFQLHSLDSRLRNECLAVSSPSPSWRPLMQGTTVPMKGGPDDQDFFSAETRGMHLQH